ncbi:MAG: uroporphyrinogen decarboxylase/cobalamine-independent methonine synthase family protein [Saccharofermentanales bacterium]
MEFGENALMALAAINGEKTKGIPTWLHHTLQHDQIEYFAGTEEGSYEERPEEVYLQYQNRIGTCLLDQYIPLNPLEMGTRGFDSNKQRGATTAIAEIWLDGMLIDSPEAAVEHMEKFRNPQFVEAAKYFNIADATDNFINNENSIQKTLGNNILKSGYGSAGMPIIDYYSYGYEYYLMAYALYPEVIEHNLKLQADYYLKVNEAAADAIVKGDLPNLIRLDQDLAGSRGTLVSIESLDRMWFPQFARCIKPLLDKNIQLIWHCDGNLMEMVPRLLDVGLVGFQGFQYEDGMDYIKICKMKTKKRDELFIIAGISVTTILPFGTPDDIKNQFKFLVENGPKTGLVLGGTSSITPGVPMENMITLEEGFKYYREHGRD